MSGGTELAADDRRVAPRDLIRAPNLRDQAVDLLREMIASGQFEPGARLNEVEIAQMMGISRGPLREAVQRLVAEGLVNMVPNLGSFVMSFTASELWELYEFREVVEAGAARMAAARATDEELAELRDLLDDTSELLATSPEGAYPVALDFHRRLLELSGNRPLLQAGIDLQMRVKLVRLRSGRSPMRARVVIGEHLEIMAAICDRDPDAAAAAAARHLANSLASVVEVLDTSETDQIAGASATAVS